MRKILFLTSSRVKLQHARYLCYDYDVQIVEKTNYGMPYREPRTSDRKKLLNESIEDAKKRLLKQRIGKEVDTSNSTPLIDENFCTKEMPLILNKIFFLEDTSVIIHSLSTGSTEFPGTDIKYWMKDNTFSSVDQLLKESGNDRRVTVRSDILLYLPKHLRGSQKRDYVQFTSFQNGTITEKEHNFNTNELYPWLDNQTFNKWFVPSGCDVPISMLSGDEALKYDIRAGAFNDMLQFLEKENFINKKTKPTKKETQGVLSFFDTPAFLICGLPCAGKTTIGEFLSDRYGYYHIEASDFMYLSYHERHGAKSSVKVADFAEKVLIENPSIVVDQILTHLEKINDAPFAITGFRSPKELDLFVNRYQGFNSVQQIIIKAKSRIRFDRGKARARKGDNIFSAQDFIKRDIQQLRMGLKEVRRKLGQNIILNNHSFEEYYDAFIEKYPNLQKTSNLQNNNFVLPQERPVDLEETILLALLNTDEHLTTTEIAHHINNRFPEGKVKETSKNNVSRYFNMRFYPYYEIAIENEKVKYSLSPTGHSHAIFLLNTSKQNLNL